MDSQRVELEQAEAAERFLQDVHEKAARVPELRQQIADRDRLTRARSVASSTEEQARGVVADVGPQLREWRVSFQDWVNAGWHLLGDLRTLESKLLPALDLAISGAVGLSQAEAFRPGTFDERVILGQGNADQAVDRLLERLGVADLGPFDGAPEGFPQEVADLCLRYSGRVFVPRLGRVQFQRGRGVGGVRPR